MDEIQRKHEHAAGDAFVDWYNRENRKRYDERPHGARDLRYVDGSEVLDVEITDAYYHQRDTVMQWKTPRQRLERT
jgi:hypothetical protein